MIGTPVTISKMNEYDNSRVLNVWKQRQQVRCGILWRN